MTKQQHTHMVAEQYQQQWRYPDGVAYEEPMWRVVVLPKGEWPASKTVVADKLDEQLARLIAAAPDLLTALEEMVKIHGGTPAARAAIKAATEGSMTPSWKTKYPIGSRCLLNTK